MESGPKRTSPKGWKWTVLKIDRCAKVDGPSKSGRSWDKLDGFLRQSGRSWVKVDGPFCFQSSFCVSNLSFLFPICVSNLHITKENSKTVWVIGTVAHSKAYESFFLRGWFYRVAIYHGIKNLFVYFSLDQISFYFCLLSQFSTQDSSQFRIIILSFSTNHSSRIMTHL